MCWATLGGWVGGRISVCTSRYRGQPRGIQRSLPVPRLQIAHLGYCCHVCSCLGARSALALTQSTSEYREVRKFIYNILTTCVLIVYFIQGCARCRTPCRPGACIYRMGCVYEVLLAAVGWRRSRSCRIYTQVRQNRQSSPASCINCVYRHRTRRSHSRYTRVCWLPRLHSRCLVCY